MIGHDLLRYRRGQKFLIMDFETCHLNLAIDNYPWQVAWLIADDTGILEKHNHFLQWGDKLNVSDGAAKATGFDPRVIKAQGEDPKKIYQKFRDDLDNPEYIKVGHNLINFDIYVERLWAREVGLPHNWSYLNSLIDTNCLAKAIKKGIRVDRENFLAWQFRTISLFEKGLKTNMTLLCKEYKLDVDLERFHKADYDIEKNLEIWNKQKWEIEI